ncbi:MAG: winged helix-turn-helix domain-containing protein [Vicinamibacterales bacterium]
MPRTVRFGAFEVDLAAGQLHKRGVRIGLREQSFQVLALLLEQPGEVVTRKELQHRLWPADVFVDFQNNLNTAVARLREALGDSAEKPRFIQTLPKHGYRFIAAVSEHRFSAKQTSLSPTRLVVLPFLNLSGDPAQDYFSDAMTDEIITELAGLAPEALSVIARTTAFRYKGSRKDITRIGHELDVEYVVEGGVRHVDDGVALTVQLVRASNQTHVFARLYQAELHDIFRIESCVARDIAAHIDNLHITQALRTRQAGDAMVRQPPTQNLGAYDAYLQGRSRMAAGTPEAFAKARQHFEEAISRDPGFALGYDGLAEIYWYLAYFGFMSPREAFSTGVLYAIRALEIDNSLGETHALLGLYHKQLAYDWPEVEREMARALELSPASPIVRERYAFNALIPFGRLEEAVAQLELALLWDPQSVGLRSHLGAVLLLWRRYDRAMEQARRILELEPCAYWGRALIASCYRDQRVFDKAIPAYREAVELSGGASSMLGWFGLSLALAGEAAEARIVMERLRERATHSYVPPTSFAWIHLGLGEIDRAFEWLDRAVEGRDQFIMPIKSYWFFDPIRSDPRFAALLRKMRLAPA